MSGSIETLDTAKYIAVSQYDEITFQHPGCRIFLVVKKLPGCIADCKPDLTLKMNTAGNEMGCGYPEVFLPSRTTLKAILSLIDNIPACRYCIGIRTTKVMFFRGGPGSSRSPPLPESMAVAMHTSIRPIIVVI